MPYRWPYFLLACCSLACGWVNTPTGGLRMRPREYYASRSELYSSAGGSRKATQSGMENRRRFSGARAVLVVWFLV